jgi:hypothetical protein
MVPRLSVTFVAIVLMAPNARAQSCGRECLRGVVDAYLAAMARHDPSPLKVTSAVKFTENGEEKKLGDGFWKTAGSATYKLYALDPDGGAAAVQAVVMENGEPITFFLRVKTQGQFISEAETIVCRKGQAGFFSPQKMTSAPALYQQTVPATERMSRAALTGVADAYFTAISTEGTPDYKAAPFAEGANRFENGEQTTNVPVMGFPAATISEQLEKGFFKGISVGSRRFPVVDTQNGLVLGIGLMSVPQGGRVLLAEMFKVTGGKIREVQAVMVEGPAATRTGWN